MSMINKHYLCVILSVLLLNVSAETYNENSLYQPYAPDGVPFCVADKDWNPDGVGNHRAVVEVSSGTKALIVKLKWRRSDRNPEQKSVIVQAAKNGKTVSNVTIKQITAEEGQILFEPTEGSGKYYIYYLPYNVRKGGTDGRYIPDWNDYILKKSIKDNHWADQVDNFTEAHILRYESRNRFEFLTSMGNIATEKETKDILASHSENPVLFTEDRAFPIRLTHQLPVRWIYNKPSNNFEGTAMRNEYYVWQLGVWAAHAGIDNVKLEFSDFVHVNGVTRISHEEITCFNQEGINWDGNPIRFTINIPHGNIQALWCGVQIPEKATPGDYKGKVSITGNNMKSREIEVLLHITNQILADKGDADLWRHSRLRWLNSRIGEGFAPVSPYKPLAIKGKKIKASEKTVCLADNGLPNSIKVNTYEVLSKPMQIVLETNNGRIPFEADNIKIEKKGDGLAIWTSSLNKQGFKLECVAQMEYDGYLDYKVKVSSANNIKVKDIILTSSFTEQASEYMMGIGIPGGKRPENHRWAWNGPYDSYWVGGVNQGLHMELRGGTYHGPLIKDYKPQPPDSWANGGKGYISVTGNTEAQVEVHTGETQISTQPKEYEFALNITPAKPIDVKKQLSMRFCHGKKYRLYPEAARAGANVFNIHHATELNPVINYPFIIRKPLQDLIEQMHKNGHKVKLYYTIREISNYVNEIYALKSLGNEIIADGNGNGAPWLCEHLQEHFSQAWYATLSVENRDMVDAAFVCTPFSRWINYYLEGLRWMLQNYKIDGIYMDDVSFDRQVMKRIRRILEDYGHDCIIDLHSNTAYSIGPANQYTDFFPYVDRLWFGESFKYNEMNPDEWLVTFSGIPFGPMSEMLQDGGNPYLGMLYAATPRHSYGKPEPLWKLWREFGIEDSKMIGYWQKDCPVTTSDDEVKATVFLKKDKVLVSIGNFSKQDKEIRLFVNWKTLKMNPEKIRIYAPEMEGLQDSFSLNASSELTVKSKKGNFFIINK